MLAPRPVLRGRGIDVGELLGLPLRGEELVELRERRPVAGRQREGSLEVGDRAHFVAEDVAEEATSSGRGLALATAGGADRMAPALGDALERERDLTQSIIAMSRLVQLLLGVGRECGTRERREHRVRRVTLHCRPSPRTRRRAADSAVLP